MITINNAVNTLVHNEYTQQKLTRLDSSKNIKQQLNNIFFTAINLEKNKEINTSQQHKSIQNESFYDKISTAKLDEIKYLLITEVETFIELDQFYCGDANHLPELNLFKKKILHQSFYTYVEDDMRHTLHNLYELNRVLKNLQYEIQTQISTIISKEVISLRLDECLGGLDKCWPGIYSRLWQEYEFLSINQQGLLGVIYTIKKNRFKEVAVKYISVNNPNLSYGVHTFNRYNNAVAGIFGLNIIEDANTTSKLTTKDAEAFTALLKIELSPATITAKLAERTHNKLAEVLAKFDMHSWLTKDITDSELKLTPEEIDNIVFAPINALFNITATQKLTINKIIDFYEKNENSMYSLKYSKEKINLWLADNIIPNSSEILVSSIENSQENKDFSIKTIGGIFFWVCYQQDDNSKIDYDDYIPLQLSHLMQIDFVSLYKANDKQIIIDLVIQALSQTNNLLIMCEFLDNDNIQLVLKGVPLLKQRIDNTLKYKIANEDFIIDLQIVVSAQNPIQKAEYLLNLAYDKGAYQAVLKLINNILNSNEISITEKTDILQTKTKEGSSLLFLLSRKEDKYLSNYVNLILDNIYFTDKQKLEFIIKQTDFWLNNFSIYNNQGEKNNCNVFSKYLELVLAYNGFDYLQKIEYMQTISNPKLISDNFTCEVAGKFINDFLTDNKITTIEKIDALHTKATNNTFLLLPLSSKNTECLSNYIRLILDHTDFTKEQKLEFIKNEVNCWLNIKKGSFYIIVMRYFELVLDYNGFDSLQKREFIQELAKSGFNLFHLQRFYLNTEIIRYTQLVLKDNNLTSEQKLSLILAKETPDNPPLLYFALKCNNKELGNYVSEILLYNGFTPQEKLNIIRAEGYNGEPGLLVALEQGNHEVVKQYLESIMYGNIDESEKINLIRAKYKDEIVLYKVLASENSKTFDAYISTILNCKGLSCKQKQQIMQINEEDINICFELGFKNNFFPHIRRYMTAILNHKEFSIKQKKLLCRPLSIWRGYTDTVNYNSVLTDTDKKRILPASSCSIM